MTISFDELQFLHNALHSRASVAQWVKCGPADLVFPGSNPAGGTIFEPLRGL